MCAIISSTVRRLSLDFWFVRNKTTQVSLSPTIIQSGENVGRKLIHFPLYIKSILSIMSSFHESVVKVGLALTIVPLRSAPRRVTRPFFYHFERKNATIHP